MGEFNNPDMPFYIGENGSDSCALDTNVDFPIKLKVTTTSKYVKTLDPKYLPKATTVADVTAAPTADQFNALLASLRNAGYLAE